MYISSCVGEADLVDGQAGVASSVAVRGIKTRTKLAECSQPHIQVRLQLARLHFFQCAVKDFIVPKANSNARVFALSPAN